MEGISDLKAILLGDGVPIAQVGRTRGQVGWDHDWKSLKLAGLSRILGGGDDLGYLKKDRCGGVVNPDQAGGSRVSQWHGPLIEWVPTDLTQPPSVKAQTGGDNKTRAASRANTAKTMGIERNTDRVIVKMKMVSGRVESGLASQRRRKGEQIRATSG